MKLAKFGFIWLCVVSLVTVLALTVVMNLQAEPVKAPAESVSSAPAESASLLTPGKLEAYYRIAQHMQPDVAFSAMDEDGQSKIFLMTFHGSRGQAGINAKCTPEEYYAELYVLTEADAAPAPAPVAGCWTGFDTSHGKALLARFDNGQTRYWSTREIPNLVKNADRTAHPR